MKRFTSALAVIGIAGVAFAQNATIIYQPVKTIVDQQISLRGWGSGTIAETDELAYEGVKSIRVSSRNLFQGGIIIFGAPIDLSAAYGDKGNMLRLTFQAPDLSTKIGGGPGGGKSGGGGAPTAGPAGFGGGPAGAGGAAGAGGGAASQGGSGKFGGAPPPGGGQGTTTSAPVPQPVLSMIRMIVTTTDGKKSEAYMAVNTSSKADRGWRQAAVPLQAITGFDRTNKIVKEIAFAGDSTATFYVGDMRVINDVTPISGDLKSNRTNLALGDEVTLTAYGYGGSSVLKYLWDFDSDGKVDAEGQVIKRKFRKPGDITVTLTVADESGLKKPYKTTLKLKVNP